MHDDDDRMDVVELLNGGFVTGFGDNGGVPISCIIVAEVMDPETGELTARITSSKGLVSWRYAGLAALLTQRAAEGLSTDWTSCDPDDLD